MHAFKIKVYPSMQSRHAFELSASEHVLQSS